ncbi:MAG TPA: nuclear transport factor 2 family protein [Thermoanaerobaculia bacterium]|nr:nuclear transport factor 2 family protein [Thermoanaerobaculia bacterium]
MEAKEALLDASNLILRAICSHDAAALSEHLAPDFWLLGSGARQDRDGFLEAVRTGDFLTLGASFETIDVEVLGDTAVVAGVQRVEVQVGSERAVSRSVFTDVFVLQGGLWLLRVVRSLELA